MRFKTGIYFFAFLIILSEAQEVHKIIMYITNIKFQSEKFSIISTINDNEL